MKRILASLITAATAFAILTACSKKASPETGALASRLQSSGIVLIDFTAAANPDCEKMQPIVEKAVAKYAGKVTLIPVDINRHPQIASGYGVTSLPHYAIMNGSTFVTNTVGIMTEPEFQKWLDFHVAAQP